MTRYRTGGHWDITIVREGTQPADHTGRRPDDQLAAVITNGDTQLAERICALLNGEAARPEPADSCTCIGTLTDTRCPVHHGRRARGPKPPPLGPGCICDGSGRTCPRHGTVQ